MALGAAIQGAALVEDKHEMILLDVTPHALGIMTFGSYFEELIPQNTTVPTSRTKIFTTSRDNQTAVKILVMQGESKKADENELLGEFILTGLRRAPKGHVEIEVTFEINTDGIVSVHAKDLETGQAQSIQVTATSGLTQDEIKQMMESAKDYLVERRSDEEFEKARQEAETHDRRDREAVSRRRARRGRGGLRPRRNHQGAERRGSHPPGHRAQGCGTP